MWEDENKEHENSPALKMVASITTNENYYKQLL